MTNEETFERLKKELEPYKNTLVISHHKIILVKDVVQEPDDFYWVTEHWWRGEVLETCVGKWTPLKGVIPDKDYNDMVITWNYNNKTKIEKI